MSYSMNPYNPMSQKNLPNLGNQPGSVPAIANNNANLNNSFSNVNIVE